MRVSFFGGGRDYPVWYRNHGGAVLATTIDKYSYITCRYLPPFLEHADCPFYSRIEHRRSLDEIAHPAIRKVGRYMNVTRAIELHHDADLPAYSGIGSSSAFTAGLLQVRYVLAGPRPTIRRLAP